MRGYPPMRLVLAARLSQLARGGETGIDTQDEDGRDWAIRNGHTIVAVAADDISGRVSPFNRKNLGPWLTDPQRMLMFDGILVSKIDRLTRKRDWDIRQWAEKHHKKILVVNPELQWPPAPGDTVTPIIWDNLVNMAAGEWTATSQRYRRMLKYKREQGHFAGKRPYGYRIVCSEQCGKYGKACEHPKMLEQDPVTSAIVRGMANRYLDGESFQKIADWLTATSVPPPQTGGRTRAEVRWSAQTVRNILRNPAISGRVKVGGHTVYRVEPIIPIDQFNKIGALMDKRGTHKMRPYAKGLLTSILICKREHRMYRIRATSKGKYLGQYYYYCNKCPVGDRAFFWCGDVDAAVDEAVLSMADIEHITTTVIPGDTYGEEINAIKGEIRALDPEDDDYITRATTLQDEIKLLRNLPRKPAEIIRKADGRSAAQVWESLGDDVAAKRAWLLARKGSNWLPEQDRVRIQVLGRDPETRKPILDIDLGEFTDSLLSLRTQ